MIKHLLCLTVDTDPDGLSGKVTNRQTLRFDGLEQLRTLPDELAACRGLGAFLSHGSFERMGNWKVFLERPLTFSKSTTAFGQRRSELAMRSAGILISTGR